MNIMNNHTVCSELFSKDPSLSTVNCTLGNQLRDERIIIFCAANFHPKGKIRKLNAIRDNYRRILRRS